MEVLAMLLGFAGVMLWLNWDLAAPTFKRYWVGHTEEETK